MRKIMFISFLLIHLSIVSYSQNFSNSNLPIVIITTDNYREIVDAPRILATMKIIYKGDGVRNYLSDQYNPAALNYNGRIDIEIRGSSSQSLPKKQYGFSTLKVDNVSNNNVSLLGMSKENDWILNGLAFDPSLLRDYLSYNLSRQIGQYASQTVYCEVVINGVYKGLYVLQEKIKQDNSRVNIAEIAEADISFPAVTGGYIVKADKTTSGDAIAWTMSSYLGSNDIGYIVDQPKTYIQAQYTYIYGEFVKLASTSVANNVSFTNGYPSVIDIPSFVDFMLLNELASNADAYTYSTFFHKDRNGKLRAGPIWDFNLTFGNDLFLWGYDRSKTYFWQFSNGENDGSRFWRDLFNSSIFKCLMAKRFNELTQPNMPLNQTSIANFIDQTVSKISEAKDRESALWGKVGDHALEISNMKTFVNTRINWMRSNLGSFSACSNVPLPPLVITKIMYHPATNLFFQNSDDQEFIEIKNNGNSVVNLTGVYFSGTGFVYQFPANSTVAPFKSVVLASNSTVFVARYNFTPFGQFTRNLNNSGENLVLADGFGNVIDHVQYSDTVPWPEADGNGMAIELKDINLDNNLASSWVATSNLISSIETEEKLQLIQLYPNPLKDYLTIKSAESIEFIQLSDIQGRIIKTLNLNVETYNLDMSNCPAGAYILRIITQNESFVRKIVKE